MMPSFTIELSGDTAQRLHNFAEPFESPERTIRRLLDLVTPVKSPAAKDVKSQQSSKFDPFSPPPLTHTKVMHATLDGKVITPKWNSILDEVLKVARRQLGAFDRVKAICPANIAEGVRTDSGYDYIPEADLSVQGQDAAAAWRAAAMMAQRLERSLIVDFVWRPKKEAAFPGQSGRLAVNQ